MKVLTLNSRNRRAGKKPKVVEVPIRLNIGSGPSKMPNFLSVDCIAFPGVDVVTNLNDRWPWKDSSVEEVHASHVLEHFDAMERVHVMNELWRVLKPGAKATIITPHWASCRAYGDPTHKWPPVSEFFWYYVSKEWRSTQAPHTDSKNLVGGFECNFQAGWGWALEPGVAARNQEYQQHAAMYFKEAIMDMVATLTALK